MSEAAARELEGAEGNPGEGTAPRAPLHMSESQPAPASPRAETAALTPAAARRVTTLVIAKGALDLLFVSALAVGFSYFAFHPHFRGSLDHADARSVRGWVVDRARPERPVEVQLYVDGRFVAAALADRPRPDVHARGYAPDERHGFVFDLGDSLQGGGEHEARVYAVHSSDDGERRTLQLVGRPLRFGAGPGR